ncbi:MAG: hypothetical protein HeimC2_45500 [Candidatus Heimdallarchaeota archaeon LC_2]|nr:MAG: hypothetical protein HeimC2_45500 [Candidatus Heimdallarchaeota archaeon LC_2]
MMVANIISTNEQDTVTKTLQYINLTHLNQLQIDSINAGLLEDQNFVIALPTGSG